MEALKVVCVQDYSHHLCHFLGFSSSRGTLELFEVLFIGLAGGPQLWVPAKEVGSEGGQLKALLDLDK